MDGHALVAVEQRHHHKAKGARHQRAESVQKYIPVRHHVIEGTHLAQEDCAVQEQDIHDVQRRRQLKAKAAGQEGGQVNHHDAQQALQQHQCVICARALQRLGGGLIPEDQAVNQIANRQDKAEQDERVNHARPFLRAGLGGLHADSSFQAFTWKVCLHWLHTMFFSPQPRVSRRRTPHCGHLKYLYCLRFLKRTRAWCRLVRHLLVFCR